MRVRIEHAKMLMVQTDQSTASIARKCGFSSLGYFTRAFRRIVGIKSQAYRKMRRSFKQFRQHSLGRTGKKGTGPICRNGPEGASHKLDLSPFSPNMHIARP